jgi:hypothetical protein
MVEAHVGDGEYEASKVYAYVYLEQVVHSPHLRLVVLLLSTWLLPHVASASFPR